MKSRIDTKTLQEFILNCRQEKNREYQEDLVKKFTHQYSISLIQPKKPVPLLQLLEGYLCFQQAKEFIFTDYKKCILECSAANRLPHTTDEDAEPDRLAQLDIAEQARLAALSNLANILTRGMELQCVYSTATLLAGMGIHESADLVLSGLIERKTWFDHKFSEAERVFDENIYLIGAMVYLMLARFLQTQYRLNSESITTTPSSHPLSIYFFANAKLERKAIKPIWPDIFNDCLEQADRLLNLNLINRDHTNIIASSVQPVLRHFFEPDHEMTEEEIPDCSLLIEEFRETITMLKSRNGATNELGQESDHESDKSPTLRF